MNTIQRPDLQQRVVRVFVSSTFRDMKRERNELVKIIFPQLRKLCEQRGVIWGEVDLRWGITEEQKAEGRVLPICLSEIKHCRPYFIGILGERYGWIPDEIPLELVKQEPWLAEQFDRSVTEMEILHGVLNSSVMENHAFFYFRDPEYLNSTPAEEKEDCLEKVSDEEIGLYGREEAYRRVEQRRQKLSELKARIRKSGYPVLENYQNPTEFGKAVLRDLTAVIDALYPEGSQPDPLDKEAQEHALFALSRSQVYIGRQDYFDRLDGHLESNSGPLVIQGASGSGKSALLANWSIKYQDGHPDDFILIHFIGSSPGSSDWAAMLRRIMGEFKRRFDIGDEIPDNPDALRSAFANWLNMAAARGRTVLILDALNQLDDRDGALDLVWLPSHIPDGIQLFVSTLPGRTMDELRKRGWPVISIEPLRQDERRQMISEYLALFTKALDKKHVEHISDAMQCGNPLFLHVLLDELRLFGEHELLDSQISLYLKAPDIPSLYALILERCERDYERDRPGLVRDAMSLLWAARFGLSETELMELLGTGGQPLPRAFWSPLFLALEQSFLSRGGLMGFFHDYLRIAVESRYLPDETAKKQVHLRLADYFEAQDGLSPRRMNELPWQLARAAEWGRLNELFKDLEFFKAAYEFNGFEVKSYWTLIEANSAYRMTDAYRMVLDKPESYTGIVWHIAMLLKDTGHLPEGLHLYEFLAGHYDKAGDRISLSGVLVNQANILYARGDLDGSMALHKEEERMYREIGSEFGLQLSLINQANILYVRGDLKGAMEQLKEAERICRELGNKDGLQRSLVNQAVILKDCGDPKGAMELLKEGERICRELGNKDGLQTSLGNQANILYARGDLDGAMVLHKEEERICRELGNKDGLQRSLVNQGLILKARGDLDGAIALLREGEHICLELGNKDGLQISLGNQAVILKARGDLDGAMALYKEQERICRELGNKHGLQVSLGNQALIFKANGDLDGALALLREEERICRELGNRDGMQASLRDQASILYDRGALDEAMVLLKEQERICRELGNKDGLQRSLVNQALILKDWGNLDWAMALLKEQERMCRELGNKDGLQRSLSDQASIIKERGDLEGAMALLKEQERICRELGNKNELQASLGSQANILYARGDLDGAMVLYKEKEHICREQGNREGLQISLGNQALILYARGSLDGAMALHKEKERICRELGNKDELQKSLVNQALIFYVRGEFDGAMALYKEQERICRELGNKEGLQMSFANQALILHARGELKGALTLYKEDERLCRELGYKDRLKISLLNQAKILYARGHLIKAIALYREQERI